MQERRQTNTTTTLVGMDLHSEKVQLCVTRWTHGADPVRERFLCTTVAALEATYRRQVPEGAVTVLEASTNAFSVARRLASKEITLTLDVDNLNLLQNAQFRKFVEFAETATPAP